MLQEVLIYIIFCSTAYTVFLSTIIYQSPRHLEDTKAASSHSQPGCWVHPPLVALQVVLEEVSVLGLAVTVEATNQGGQSIKYLHGCTAYWVRQTASKAPRVCVLQKCFKNEDT